MIGLHHPSLSFRDIFHSGLRSKLCLRCKCALSELKQTVFAFKTTKMLISDIFGVVYRIIDLKIQGIRFYDDKDEVALKIIDASK